MSDILLPYDLPEVLYRFHRMPIVNGRLTLTTAVPVTTSDVTAAATVYFTPYLGNYISLWTGNWNVYEFEQASLDISALTTATLYNVYGYWTGQELALESSTTATATQEGRYIKSGDPTRLYLGSFYTSATGKTEDSLRNRLVWNYYNRKWRKISYANSATSHTYATTTYRTWNNDSTLNAKFVVGVVEDTMRCNLFVDVTAATLALYAIGLNSTSSGTDISALHTSGAGRWRDGGISLELAPQAGLNTIYPLEYSSGTSTFTEFTINGAALI